MRLRCRPIFKLLLIFCISIPKIAVAQSTAEKAALPPVFSLEIKSLVEEPIFKKFKYKKTFATKPELEKELRNVLFYYFDKAYITASYDSLIIDSLSQKAYISLGAPYKWAFLKNGNIDEGVLSEMGFREKLYSNQPVYYKGVKRIQEKIITYYENNGYPFASIKLDSIIISDGSISAQLKLTKNSEEKIDSIIIK